MKTFTNLEIAHLFRQVAASYAIKDEQKYKFQIIAYQKAADAIEKLGAIRFAETSPICT